MGESLERWREGQAGPANGEGLGDWGCGISG